MASVATRTLSFVRTTTARALLAVARALTGVEYRDRALLGAQPWVDHAGNVFESDFWLRGNESAVEIRRYNPAGELTGQWTLRPPTGFKVDGYGIFQSGAHLLVLLCGHEAIADPQRRNIVWRDQVENVAVPYPQGFAPVGAETDMDSWRGVDPNPAPEVEVDYERIRGIVQTVVAAEVNRLASQFGGGSVRGGIQEKVEDALVRLFDPDYQGDDPRPARFREGFSATLYRSAGLFQRLTETVFLVVRDNKLIEAAYKVLGLPPPGDPK